MFLKTHRLRKDGKEHLYYSLCESLRVSRSRVTQRTVLHLGELNTTQVDRWERTIETVHEDGRRQQLRLFTDRQGRAPAADDVAEVLLSSLVVRRSRRWGECWIGCKLWEELGLRAFWDQALGEQRGEVPWAKVVELLAVNRLCAPRSELSVHVGVQGWAARFFRWADRFRLAISHCPLKRSTGRPLAPVGQSVNRSRKTGECRKTAGAESGARERYRDS